MSVKAGGAVIAILVIAVAAYGLWLQHGHPRVVVSTGTVRVDSAAKPDVSQILKTRVVDIGRIRVTEVELPNGTWIDCSGDCRKTALEAVPEFFEALSRSRGR